MRLPTRVGSSPAAVNRYLLPNEHQVITVRRHPAVLIGPSVLTLGGLLVAAVLSATVLHGNDTLIAVVWLAWLVLFVRLIWKAINWAVDFFVVTSHRILLTSGVVTRKVNMMPLTKVTDMSFQRTLSRQGVRLRRVHRRVRRAGPGAAEYRPSSVPGAALPGSMWDALRD